MLSNIESPKEKSRTADALGISMMSNIESP